MVTGTGIYLIEGNLFVVHKMLVVIALSMATVGEVDLDASILF
jgi:hypothetical protein